MQAFHYLSLFLGFSLVACECVAAAATTPLRWAVVSSPEVQQLGVPDLVTVKLTEMEGVELVERDRLRDATRELRLAELLGPADVDARIKLGALVGADVLVFLSFEEPPANAEAGAPQPLPGEHKTVRVVISHCKYGVRFRSARLKLEPDQTEQTVQQIAELAANVQKRYADGIKQVVAVSPFISRNLVDTHYHLQQGFRRVLEQSLEQYPALVLVELDEAKRLAIELARTHADPNVDRPAMVYAEGEFQVVPGDGDPPKFNVALIVRNNEKQLRQFKWQDTEQAIADKLSAEAAPEIAALSALAVGQPQDRLTQAEMLGKRAKAFEDIGDYRTAIELREAVLLLAPEHFTSRIAAVDDWRQVYNDRSAARAQTQEGVTYISAQRMARHRALCQTQIRRHVRDCISRKIVNWREAAALYKVVPNEIVGMHLEDPISAEDAAELKRRLDSYFAFHDEIVLLAKGLDHNVADGHIRTPFQWSSHTKAPQDGWDRARQRDHWHSTLIESLVELRHGFPSNIHRPVPSEPFFADRLIVPRIATVLTELVDKDEPLPVAAIQFAMPFCQWQTTGGNKRQMMVHSRPELFHKPLGTELEKQFLQTLATSKRPANKFLAQAVEAWAVAYRTPFEKFNRTSLAKVESLAKAAEAGSYGNDVIARIKSLDDAIRQALSDSKPAAAQTTVAKKDRPRRKPVRPKLDYTLEARKWEMRREPEPRVRFQPVTGFQADWLGLIRASDQLDVVWNREGVWAMSKPGELKPIFTARQPNQVDDVVYDGTNLWLVTLKGIAKIATDGTLQGHLGYGATLPDPQIHSRHYNNPRDTTLRLVPLDNGRMLAAGNHGEKERLFLALIESTSQDTLASTVIHTAMQVPKEGRSDFVDDGADKAYPVLWTLSYLDPRMGSPIVLIGRSGNSLQGLVPESVPLLKRPIARPLAFNPATKTVEVFPASLPFASIQTNLYAHDKQIFAIKGFDVVRAEPVVADDEVTFQETSLLGGAQRWTYDRHQWLRSGDDLYAPGAQWGKLNLKSGQFEMLATAPLPIHHCYSNYAVSAHYGLVAWNDLSTRFRNVGHGHCEYNAFNHEHLGTLFQVRIDQPPDVPAQEEHIPPAGRERHAKAVEHLRSCGAIVAIDDTTNSTDDLREDTGIPKVGLNLELSTVVILTEKWTGDGRDLLRINDLYGPVRLGIYGAPIDNNGLKVVGQLRSLEALGLYDLDCNDAGLRHLNQLKRLCALELSGPTGYEFTAKGLAALVPIPLEALSLSGAGFNDATVRLLPKFTSLKRLRLKDDTISNAAIQRLRTKEDLIVDR